jgi:hypothetical protein
MTNQQNVFGGRRFEDHELEPDDEPNGTELGIDPDFQGLAKAMAKLVKVPQVEESNE